MMKTGIFIASAALALVVFAVPEAEGKNGRLLNLRLSGSSFTTSSQADGTPTPFGEAATSLQSGIAKGSGSPLFSAQTVIDEALLDDRCPDDLPFGGDLSVISVFTFKDGSMFSTASGTDNFFCSDGVVFVAEVAGIVTGGDGRFEGATGTFELSAQVDGNRLTGNVRVDLD